MSYYEELLERAKIERLPTEQLVDVVHQVQHPQPQADLYTLLYILGLSGDASYRHLMEKYLESPDDPMLARMALHVLCNYWDLADQYTDQVLRFLQGVPWDDEEDVRLVAISIAGRHLRLHPDSRLLGALISIFENPEEGQTVREAAYQALAIALGRSQKDLPPASRHFDLTTETDPTVLQQARRRLLEKRG